MADNYNVKNAAGDPITIRAKETAAGIFSNFVHMMTGGTEVADGNPLPVKGGLVVVSNEFTRNSDTNAYAIGHLVGNAANTPLTIANCARVDGGSGYIVRATLITDLKSITPSFRVRVFNAAPTQSNDKTAYRSLYADASKRVGEFILGPMSTPSDTTNSTASAASDMNLRVPFVCAAGTKDLLFLFEALTAFTPTSGQKFTLQLAIDQN